MSALAAFQANFFEELFGETPSSRPGLEIHRRNVASGLHDALAAAYPVVGRLVGEAFFREAARRHAAATRPDRADLNAYGAGFAAFLAAYAPAARLAALADVARLEWAMHEAACAPDAAPLAFARLAMLDGPGRERLRLRVHPSARFVASRHPVLAIWEANQPGRDGTPARGGGRVWLLVRRVEGRTLASSLDGREWRFLRRLACGEPLAAACGSFGAQAARRLAPVLARHARAGLFVDFEGAASVAR